jgi:hypothetical protein
MQRYYFDIHFGGESASTDEEGTELSSVEAAQNEAIRALFSDALDMMRGRHVRALSINVRDDLGPVLRASLNFEIHRLDWAVSVSEVLTQSGSGDSGMRTGPAIKR